MPEHDLAHDVFLADCPARLAVEIITSKWAVVVLFALSRRPCRHGELVGLVGGLSRKVLTQTLRRLQGYGLVERRPHASAPPSRSPSPSPSPSTSPSPSPYVEYALTDLGLTLVEPIAALTDWARSYGEAVADFQEAARAQDGAAPAR